MRLTFLGAAGMVTGSSYLLEAGGLRLLVDCGLFQGKHEELNRKPFGFHPATLDGVILTHAHIDHSGRLPLLRKQGYTGPVYAHPATIDLARIMLLDSAYIHETEAERENRKLRRAGRPLVEPLYTQDDARAVMQHFRPIPYDQAVSLNEHVQVRLHDAGHILGSCIAELLVTDRSGRPTRICFTGDLGQPSRPILRDPTPIAEADYLIMESTYGDRLHQTHLDTRETLAHLVHSTVAKGGNVIIPAFAVGRTQELLYELNQLVEGGRLPADLQIILDSPLAIAATEITEQHKELFDEQAKDRARNGAPLFAFPGLRLTHTAEESRGLNLSREPMLIIAASGMCEAGRIVHHLKHNLWRAVCTVLFVGFQAEGTLGRRLVDGARRVRIMGEDVAVRARIESLPGLSAHADQAQLLNWVDRLKSVPLRTFLVHGEADSRAELARLLAARGHLVEMPVIGQSFPLQMAAAVARRKPKPVQGPTRIALSDGAALAASARRMAALLKEFTATRKAWHSNGPHLPPGQAEELQQRAEELLRSLEEMRRLIDSAGE